MMYAGVMPGDIVSVKRETWIDGPSEKAVDHWVKVKLFFVAAEVPANNGAFHARDDHGERITLNERDCLEVYRRQGDQREMVFRRKEKPVKTDSEVSTYVAKIQRANIRPFDNGEGLEYWEGRCLDMGERVD